MSPKAAPTVADSGRAYRPEVWRRMLDAEMNGRYWRGRASGLAQREKSLKIFLAVTSSATVAGWTVWHGIPPIWQVLSGLSAIVAVALPILDYTSQIERASDLRSEWLEVAGKYNRLWAEINANLDGPVSDRLQEFQAKEAEMAKIESKHFTRNDALIRKSQREVLVARGLAPRK
jgi:hypothetical protein